MLDEAGQQFDFAVIILTNDDVTVTKTDDTFRARDTSAFQAGLFIANGRPGVFS